MEIEGLKYNYIVCGAQGFYEIAYHDLCLYDNVSFFSRDDIGFENVISHKLLRLNFSKKINRYLECPFRHFVFPRLLNHSFPNNKPICYIFFGNTHYIFQSPFIQYIRKHSNQARIVIFLHDLISTTPFIDIEQLKSRVDIIISYDKNDADKYGLYYHSTPYSFYEVTEEQTVNGSDIYFCGKGKNRLKTILEIFEKCQSEGLRCDFNILDSRTSERVYSDLINYEQPLGYTENILHLQQTKCILEVMQEGAIGYTPRLWESLMYSKHLLTNNTSITDSPYYDKYVHTIDSLADLHWINVPVVRDDSVKEGLSPVHIIKFIDSIL